MSASSNTPVRGALRLIDVNAIDHPLFSPIVPVKTPARKVSVSPTTRALLSIADSSTPASATTNCTTPGTTTTTPGKQHRTPGRTPTGKIASPLPIQQRKKTTNAAASPQKQREEGSAKKTKKKSFARVCNERVGEDENGDFSEMGIQEWTLDDFVYVKKLGKGGTSDVYLAQEVQSGHLVALKVQRDDDNAMCEIDVHQPLDHPNVVTMIDYFYSYSPFGPVEEQDVSTKGDSDPDTKYLYMILEVCDGGSIHDVMEANPDCLLPEYEAAQYFMGILNAIEYLHSEDIIHCDCKPANFLVDTKRSQLQYQVKLADFGMSVLSYEKEIVGGTPVYMSPEHLMAWRHDTEDFDHRIDIYSLGVLLYEMLLGYLPYEIIEDEDDAPSPAYKGTGVVDTYKEIQPYEESSTEQVLESLNNLNISDEEDDEVEDDDEEEEEDEESKSTEDEESYENDESGYTEEYEEDEESEFKFPVLDLRKLNDKSSDEPFYIPPPVFLEDITLEAQDLILRLMAPNVDDRISLEDAKNHPWFQIMSVQPY